MKKPVWSEQPPPIRRPREGSPYDWPVIIAALKDRPGQWLLVDDNATPGAPQVVRERRATALRDDEWDFHVTTRGNDHTIRRSQMWVSATPKKKEE